MTFWSFGHPLANCECTLERNLCVDKVAKMSFLLIRFILYFKKHKISALDLTFFLVYNHSTQTLK